MVKIEPMWRKLLKNVLLPLGALAVVVFFGAALQGVEEGQSEKGLEQLEEALRRGCVACYAAEGAYPSSLAYLEEHYGIQVDESRYAVYYVAYAENLMPDIIVLERS